MTLVEVPLTVTGTNRTVAGEMVVEEVEIVTVEELRRTRTIIRRSSRTGTAFATKKK